jgi:hypothetical protein
MGFLDKYSKYKREKRRQRKATEAAQSLAAARSLANAQSPVVAATSLRAHAHRRARRTDAWAAGAAPRQERSRDRHGGHGREGGVRGREKGSGNQEQGDAQDAISLAIARTMEKEWASRRGKAREDIDVYVDR